MRISIIGVPGLGEEYIQQMFHKNWNMYEYVKFPEIENVESLEDDYIKTATKMLEQIEKYNNFDDCVLFESIPLELLISAVINNEAGEISDDCVKKLFEISFKALNKLDCVFIIPKSKYNAVEDVNIQQSTIDDYGRLYDMIIHAYGYGTPCPFFNPNNCPGFIEVFGTDEQKLELFKQYIDEHGKLIEGNIQKLLPSEQVEGEEILKNAIDDQKQKIKKEAFWKQLNSYKHGKR